MIEVDKEMRNKALKYNNKTVLESYSKAGGCS